MPTIGIGLSLSVIIGVLVVTTIASLVAVRRNPALAAAPAQRPIATMRPRHNERR